jgi:polyisoprenoid-binding protein YceI
MTIHRAGMLVAPLLLLLTGCPTPSSRNPGSAPTPPLQQSSGAQTLTPRHLGRPYDIDAQDSVLVILAFRGGALSKAGHNHVIAAHDLAGAFYVPANDLSAASFEMQFSVAELRVDEPALRAREGTEFPPDVPEAAKEGTRRNMLSDALLNGAHYPTIQLSAPRLQAPTDVRTHTDGSQQGRITADVTITVRDQAHTIEVPVQYALDATQIVASGELTVRQSELGLTPFSAMLGALQVQDELRVKFHVVARAASGLRGQ